MSAVKSTDKINQAIRECLARCYSSPTPVLSLTEFLKSLSESREWERCEVAKVRSAAVHILRNVAAPDDDDELPLGFTLTFLPDDT
jgi:hypothetical protein